MKLVNFDTSDVDTKFVPSVGGDETDDDDELEGFEMMDEAERKECDFFTTYLDDYAVDDNIFSAEEIKSSKQREKAMIERNEMSYCRCKENTDSCIMTSQQRMRLLSQLK